MNGLSMGVRFSMGRILTRTAVALAGLYACVGSAFGDAGELTHVIRQFDGASQPTYLIASWQDNVTIEHGALKLRGVPCDGGAGFKMSVDLTQYRDWTPVLSVKTTAASTAKALRLKLVDADGRSASWSFELPAPSAEFIELKPLGSISLDEPERVENTKDPTHPIAPDLSRIAQVQLLGDWSKASVDAEVRAVEAIPADDKMRAERVAFAAQQAEIAKQDATKAKAIAAKQEEEKQAKIRIYSQRSEHSPQVTDISLVTPDTLSLTIEAQNVIGSTLSKYEPQDGDEKRIEKWQDGTIRQAMLKRRGKVIGRLLGKDLDWFETCERLDGDPLLESFADDPANYVVKSADDSAFALETTPSAVYRKTVPSNVVLPGGQYSTRHRIYLKLPHPVQESKSYVIALTKVNVRNGNLTFKADLSKTRSEAVHVNQIGYRPDDPVKQSFLSLWMGSGGPCVYPDSLRFSLIDESTNQKVFEGAVENVLKVDGKEPLWTTAPKNFSGTAVYKMDFSRVTKPGKYRVYVNGIGCSYPFLIDDSVWEHAFSTQMKGLYNQRSGTDLGPPYSEFRKPADFNPAGATRSTYNVLSKGLTAYNDIAKGDTGEPVSDAWGGYHDAGDWNPRRVTHMYTTMAQLELCELYPDYFDRLKLNIPPTDGLPDMITEALFEIDCFRRLQWSNGAVPYGIETQGDPLAGEVSWLSTMHCYVLSPDVRDSWLYAAVAARAAKVLKPIQPNLSDVYLASSKKAFEWAENEYAKMLAHPSPSLKKDLWDAIDARNLASLILYELTGEKSYDDIFRQDTVLNVLGPEPVAYGYHIQCDAVFAYARMDAAKTDPTLRERACADVRELAERSIKFAASNAFNITQREPGRPMFAGFFSTSGGTELVRAYYLLHKPAYLAGAVQSCQFQAGCNPNNLVYTTGLGMNPVRHPLNLDARSSGQNVPVGLTVFGNSDYFNFKNSFWDINLQFVNQPAFLWPDAYSWPLEEAYFDVWMLVSANEYVIDTWAPNVLVWGCLAARPPEAIKE